MPTNAIIEQEQGKVPVLVQFKINGRPFAAAVAPDMTLYDLLREQGYTSVKCGCETSNCGLCTVWLDELPVLSCAVLVASIEGKEVTTLEALRKEAKTFGKFLADEGGEQCGFCIPGMVMNVLWLARVCKAEGRMATDQEIKQSLLGNLCRCSGYQAHTRAIRRYLKYELSTEQPR